MGDTFGSRMKTKRKELKLNQQEFAEKAKSNQTRISNIETGKAKDITLAEANDIAKAAKVSIDWLCTGDETAKPITPLQWFQFTRELINNPPHYLCQAPSLGGVSTIKQSLVLLKPDKDKNASISFIGKDLESFFFAYNALCKCDIEETLLDSMVASLFNQFSCFFTPGWSGVGNYHDGLVAEKKRGTEGEQ